MKAGVGGADEAWLEGVRSGACIPSFGSCEDVGRFEAVVLTDRFFMFLIFFCGESDLSMPGKIGNEFEYCSFLSMLP